MFGIREELAVRALDSGKRQISSYQNPTARMQLSAMLYAITNAEMNHLEALAKNPTDEAVLLLLTHYPKYYPQIKNPTVEMARHVLNAKDRFVLAIKDIPDSTDFEQICAVKKDWKVIEFIKNQCEEAQIIAVEASGDAYKYIINPSVLVAQKALKKNYNAIKDIPNPTEEEQCEAVTQSWEAIKLIESPCENAQIIAAKINPLMLEEVTSKGIKPSEIASRLVLAHYPAALRFISVPTSEEKLIALNQDGDMLQYISDATEEENLAAVTQKGSALRFIANQTNVLQKAALIQDLDAAIFIKKPDLEILAFYIPLAAQAIKTLRELCQDAIEVNKLQKTHVGRLLAEKGELEQSVATWRGRALDAGW